MPSEGESEIMKVATLYMSIDVECMIPWDLNNFPADTSIKRRSTLTYQPHKQLLYNNQLSDETVSTDETCVLAYSGNRSAELTK